MRSLTGLALAVGLASVNVAAAAPHSAKPLFAIGTESSTKHLALPPPQIVSVILASLEKDEVAELDECLTDKGLKAKDYRQLLRAEAFSPAPDHKLYFVRGGSTYCSALYGAHNFAYFLVDLSVGAGRPSAKVVFQNRGDTFAIFRDVHHGLNDIEAGGCIVSECSGARMSFDGQRYRTVSCTVTTFDTGHEITKPRRCGSDEFKDDQSSGFVPRSGR